MQNNIYFSKDIYKISLSKNYFILKMSKSLAKSNVFKNVLLKSKQNKTT